uniref:Secreted protein n=1 Tax=Oryza nivara TaxID=4536 RepID=A0A0E0IBN2_ORYNI
MAAARSRAPWLDLAVVGVGWAWGGTEVDAARGGAVGEGRRLSRCVDASSSFLGVLSSRPLPLVGLPGENPVLVFPETLMDGGSSVIVALLPRDVVKEVPSPNLLSNSWCRLTLDSSSCDSALAFVLSVCCGGGGIFSFLATTF